MTEQPQPVIRYRRTDAPGVIYGVPDGDLTQADVDRIPPYLLREVIHSALYAAVDLTPAQKAAVTRAANQRAEEEAAAQAAAQEAEAQADADAEQAGADTGEGGE